MTAYRAFGLHREPFGSELDAAMFHPALGHLDCAERVRLAVRARQGLAVVAGESGLGKSTLKLVLLAEWRADSRMAVGVVDDPRVCRTDVQFLRAILGQFGIAAAGRSALELATEFARAAEAMADDGRRPLLVIDDAHLLVSSQLDLLRTLLSFEAPAGILDVVLFAEPELRDKIARKRALASRMAMDHTLNPINRRDTGALIAHRVRVAAGDEDTAALFSDEAIDELHVRSRGVPGALVRLCAAAMDEALARGRGDVDLATVEALPADAEERTSDLPIQTRLPIPEATASARGMR